jgi:hypothetical protein
MTNSLKWEKTASFGSLEKRLEPKVLHISSVSLISRNPSSSELPRRSSGKERILKLLKETDEYYKNLLSSSGKFQEGGIPQRRGMRNDIVHDHDGEGNNSNYRFSGHMTYFYRIKNTYGISQWRPLPLQRSILKKRIVHDHTYAKKAK